MEYLTREDRGMYAFLIARVVREICRLDGPATEKPTGRDVKQLASRLLHAYDEGIDGRFGVDLTEVILTRQASFQLLAQRDARFDLVLLLHTLFDADSDSLLGVEAWRSLLGVDFRLFVVFARYLAKKTSAGPFNMDPLWDDESVLLSELRRTVEYLTGDIATMRAVPPRNGSADENYDQGPLLRYPLYLRGDGRVGAASPKYVRLAASIPGLYIKLIQADSQEGKRSRANAVGEKFERYLYRYALESIQEGWVVRDLDSEPSPGKVKIADLAVWPRDRAWLLIIESKATLQSADAQLGDDEAKQKAANFYQGCFDQIDSTVRSIDSSGFISDAPIGVTVFGLVVTLEPHITTQHNSAIYPGMVLPEVHSESPSAQGEVVDGRLISAHMFSLFLDVLRFATSSQVHGILTRMAAAPDLRDIRGILSEEIVDIPDLPANPLVQEAFDFVSEGVGDEAIASVVRQIARSELG